MFLMYVDESGDCGIENTPSRYFVLTGIVIHELRWKRYLNEILKFRRRIRESFGLKLREEIHAARLITKPGNLVRIKRNDRLTIIRWFTGLIASFDDINVLNVVIDKKSKPKDFDVFGMAWKTLIQRFENTLSNRNFRGPVNADDRGLVIPDHTDDKKLKKLMRKLRRYNPIPNRRELGHGYRDLPIKQIIEDPIFRDSEDSYFIQAADLAAYLCYQHFEPNSYMKKTGAHNYLKKRLKPVLCTVASSKNEYGIVEI